ncbi:MAG: hypothetical protein RL347_2088, partial [Actinomycetota bacterium]
MTHPSQRQLIAQVAAITESAVLTTRDAGRLGITKHRLARAAEAGLLHRVVRGHYGRGDDPLDAVRHHIERLAERGIPAVLGILSAAPIWGVPAFGHAGPVPTHGSCTLLVPRGADVRQGTRHGVRIKVADLDPGDITTVAGVPITTPLRTGLDVARDLGRCRLSALVPLSGGVRAQAEWLMNTARRATRGDGCGPVTAHDVTERLMNDVPLREALVAQLHEAIEHVNSRGMLWVRRVRDDVKPLLETALETVAWSVITASDLPRPEPQRVVAGRSGKKYRVDFLLE